MKWIILSLMIFLICTQKEKFTEIFGFAGYSNPILDVKINENLHPIDMSQYDSVITAITPDEMQKLVMITQKVVNKDTGLCTYVINTEKALKYIHKKDKTVLYQCKFMFIETKGFTFGFGVHIDILDGRPVNVQTQPLANFSQASGTDEIFKSYDEIQQNNVPTFNELKSL
jgi:hypothetical protein